MERDLSDLSWSIRQQEIFEPQPGNFGWMDYAKCPRRPREITKMWHMLEKLISLIFCLEIPHDELINVVYLFYSDLLLFSKKIGKIVHVANRYKMADIKGPNINTRTSLLKSAEASSCSAHLVWQTLLNRRFRRQLFCEKTPSTASGFTRWAYQYWSLFNGMLRAKICF